MSKARVKVPKKVAKGEVFEVKTLISHKMESGQRKDKKTGEKIPRQIINKFEVMFNGKEVLSSTWEGAISANPYMAFNLKASESGTLSMKWYDDNGKVYSKDAKITVT